ncbi:hypothetical protein RLOC_00008076 [Lonchura striata]|uniref:Uncharacterized protein n=1 Tax=Lonchura striata TaxID=40157 RepID=A0A218V820_9PASE|nr:hypothetical protein RLOC_00008076 [Lonchura striata domestica]
MLSVKMRKVKIKMTFPIWQMPCSIKRESIDFKDRNSYMPSELKKVLLLSVYYRRRFLKKKSKLRYQI